MKTKPLQTTIRELRGALILSLFLFLSTLNSQLSIVFAQVPQLLHYQGRAIVGNVNFEGTGLFKFALVNGGGTTTYWSNNGTSSGGSQPTGGGVSLTVTKGLYAVLLGDTTLPNMTAVPASVFANPDVRLRIWFNDGVHGYQQVSPDHRIAAVGYAMAAASGTFPWEEVTGTAQQALPNRGYVANNVAQVTITLPPSPAIGDVVRVSGLGAGGWKIAQNNGQTIRTLNIGVGLTWTPTESSRLWVGLASSADGSKLVAAVASGQIYTSTDSGLNWTARETNRDWKALASSADGSKLVAVVYNGSVFTSTDSGVSWTATGPGGQWEAVASSADGNKLVAVMGNGQIHTSTDSGATWIPRESNRAWNSVASSDDGSKLVAGVYGGQIYTSTDSGVSWTPRESNRNWRAVASSDDGNKLVAAVGFGLIYTSTDSGLNWTARDSSRNWWAAASSSDGSKLTVVVSLGQIYTSTDSGFSWSARETSRNWNSVASSADGSKLVAAAYGGQIYTSTGSTTPGVAGYLTGDMNSAVELQYLGGGQFRVLSREGIFGAY